MKYRIFKRSWWRDNSEWPSGLEPHAGKKQHIKYVDTEQEAREFCTEQNKINNPGKYSIKCEFEAI